MKTLRQLQDFIDELIAEGRVDPETSTVDIANGEVQIKSTSIGWHCWSSDEEEQE